MLPPRHLTSKKGVATGLDLTTPDPGDLDDSFVADRIRTGHRPGRRRPGAGPARLGRGSTTAPARRGLRRRGARRFPRTARASPGGADPEVGVAVDGHGELAERSDF